MRFLPMLLLMATPLLALDSVPEFKGSIERHDPALDLLIAPEARIEVLAHGFTWSEGPVWFEGGLVFSDVPKNIAYKWKEGDKAASVFLSPSGATKVPTDQGSNGLARDAQGRLILCQGGIAASPGWRRMASSPTSPTAIKTGISTARMTSLCIATVRSCSPIPRMACPKGRSRNWIFTVCS